MTDSLHVEAENGSYRVDIGEDIFQRIEDVLSNRDESVTKVFVVTDDNVREYWLNPLLEKLEDMGVPHDHLIVPAGESSKSLSQLGDIWTDLLEKQGDRSSVIAALGGGVVGDLAGFAASTFMRGISLIHVPTSLLAQVDSCIGGKVGINLPAAKNAVGSFYPPLYCCVDVQTLSTLPDREFRAGLSETIKYGLILDASFLDWINASLDRILDRTPDVLTHLVRRSIACKVDVVERDEKESGLRQILNFGHTFGHGIEAATAYDSYLHGEAIAPGMLGSIRLSELTDTLQDRELFTRVKHLFERIGLPTEVPEITADDILPHLKHDKKSKKGEPRWVLIQSPGNVTYGNTVPRDTVISSMSSFLA